MSFLTKLTAHGSGEQTTGALTQGANQRQRAARAAMNGLRQQIDLGLVFPAAPVASVAPERARSAQRDLEGFRRQLQTVEVRPEEEAED